MVKLAALFAFIALAVSGCGPQNQTYEIEGSPAERVAGVSRVIQSHTTLPSEIQDAHLIELQLGDGELGPSDFQSFVWIKVAPDDVAKWKAVLKTPPSDPPTYDAPTTNPKWWLLKATYSQLTKFDSYSIFNRHGWIAIDDEGNIFAMTFTQ